MTQDLVAYSLAGGAAMVLLKTIWARLMGGERESIPNQIRALEAAINLRFEGIEERLDSIEESLLISDTKKIFEDKELTKLKAEHDANMKEGGHCHRATEFGVPQVPLARTMGRTGD